MARDDYPVIVYQILSALYKSLKAGRMVDVEELRYDGKYMCINEIYWQYIIQSLLDDGYIKGPKFVCNKYINQDRGEWSVVNLDKTTITPEGIRYLMENSWMHKVSEIAKSTISIGPLDLLKK